jgi:RHS repeat-associated protein
VPSLTKTYSYAGIKYSNPDAPTSIATGYSTSTLAYDNDGNLIQKTTDGTTTTYAYDYANRLIAIGVGGATTTYGYDAFGTRVLQTGTSTTNIYPFKWYSIASSTGSGAKFATTTEYVFNGDTLVSTVDQELASGVATGSAKTLYIHPHHLGSTNVVTDASGTVVQTLDYYPYGATRINSTSGNYSGAGRQYVNRFADQSSLDYLQNRYYDPSRGQFVTEDPAFWSVNQNLTDPQSFNAYSYANDNPITGKDPNGLDDKNTGTIISLIEQAIAAIEQEIAILSGSGGSSQKTTNGGAGATSQQNKSASASGGVSFGYQWKPGFTLSAGLGSTPALTIPDKIIGQMPKRGWNKEAVKETYEKPFTTRPSVDRTGSPSPDTWEPATAYFNQDGTYVVVNDNTGKVVQISDNNKVRAGSWAPDRDIQNPYAPQESNSSAPLHEGPIDNDIPLPLIWYCRCIMNEIQQFLYDAWSEPYGVGMLTAEDALKFVRLCMKNNVQIHGFDGFHRRLDISDRTIQIDQQYSADYSETLPERAYELASEYFQQHQGDNMLYEIAYPAMAEDFDIVRRRMEQNGDMSDIND